MIPTENYNVVLLLPIRSGDLVAAQYYAPEGSEHHDLLFKRHEISPPSDSTKSFYKVKSSPKSSKSSFKTKSFSKLRPQPQS
eukprot:9254201-Ditylum_brightwellii.AAC.1